MGGRADTIRVLHVETDPDFAELTETVLERQAAALTVDHAPDAASALRKLEAARFDCVVSDYELPGDTGIDLLQTVREREAELPFILFTGRGSEGVASEAIGAGVTDYLQKDSGIEQFQLLARRIRAAVDRRRAETNYREIFEKMPDGVLIQDAEDGSFVEMNERFAALFGYDRDELMASGFETLHAGEDEYTLETARERIREAATGGPRTFEWRAVRKSGEEFWAAVHLAPARIDGTRRILAVVRDVSARKERERAIAALHTTAQEFARADSPDEVADIAVETVRDLLGLPAGALYRFDETTATLEPAAWTEEFREVAGGVSAVAADDGPVWETYVDGSERVRDGTDDGDGTAMASELVLPLGDHGVLRLGSARPGAVTQTDVSVGRTLAIHAETALDRLDRERELGRHSALLESLQERTQSLMHTTTPADTGQVGVDAAHEVLGAELSGVHLLGDDGKRLEPAAFVDTVRRTLDEPPVYARSDDGPAASLVWDVFETGTARHVPDTTQAGALAEETPARSAIVHPLDGHGVFIVSATEPNAFDDTEEALVDILATSLTAALDRAERETRLREREQQLAAERDRLQALFEMVPEPIGHVRFEDDEPILQAVNPAYEETFGVDEATVRGESVNDILVEPEHRAEAEQTDELVREQGTVKREVRRKTADGIGDFLFRSVPVGESASTDEYLGLYVDISERKAHQRQLERQNDRLEEFASLVSHDLRNPLTVAAGRLELLKQDCESEHITGIERAHQRMDDLIDDLLALARHGEEIQETEPLDLGTVVEECAAMVAMDEASLAVETDARIFADRSRLDRLVENLLRNAIEHAGPDVTVTVGDLPDGFFVADDGPGIPPEDRSSVFDSGFTTSPDGTGFGLSIVREIADAHGWAVDVTEASDGGARFEITGIEFV